MSISSSNATTAATRAPSVSPAALKDLIRDGGELAIIDVREEGAFSRKHLLLAGNAPLWRLELLIGKLVPRRASRVVVVDLDGSLAVRAVEKLQALGYANVSVLAGGTLAWEAAGFEVFSGINLLSKAFGEVIEAQLHTPHIDVEDLQQRLQRGDNLVVLDGRTPEEFRNFSIPGAHSVPNAELVYRIDQLAPDPETLVVINCAGRTRSILGAQGLISAGVPHRVVALKDGTMAWLKAGYGLQNGVGDALPEPSAEGLDIARLRAAALADKVGLRHIDARELEAFRQDSSRTLYTFDVRSREEYEAGHLPGWRWAPGGQLVQATDQYIGTRHARVVIADWDGVRAHTTGAWLSQLGSYEVFLVRPDAAELEVGPEARHVFAHADAAAWISARQLAAQQQAGAALAVFDVDSSLAFARQHIVGARFAAPDRLPEFIAGLPADTRLVITSADGLLARNVATELVQRHGRDAVALAGGNAAWFALGLPTSKGRDSILTGDDDDWYSPYAYETEAERFAKFTEYLDWEVALADQLIRDGDIRIKLVA